MKPLVCVFLTLCLLLLPGPWAVKAAGDLNGATVAVYNGRGAWNESVAGFENFLDWKGISWEEVRARDINEHDLRPLYKVLFMPGGYAATYSQAIKESGLENIRNFVDSGGAYLGTCAGAYFAADYSVWADETVDYPLGLFQGYVEGADQEIGFGDTWLMTLLRMNKSNLINTFEPDTTYMLYYGGPRFVVHRGQPVDVLATYEVGREPAAINFTYGSGRVALLGTHPEINVDSDRPDNVFQPGLSEYGSDWPFLWTAMDWLLGQSISRPPELTDTLPPVISSVNTDTNRVERGRPLTVMAAVTDDDAVKAVSVTVQGNQYDMARINGHSVLLDESLEPGSFVVRRGRRGGPGSFASFEKSLSTVGLREIEITYVRPRGSSDSFTAEWSDGSRWNYLERPVESQDSGAGAVLRVFRLPGAAAGKTDFRVRLAVSSLVLSRGESYGHIKITAKSAEWKYSLDTSGLRPGTYTYVVSAEDVVGNTATPVAGQFTVVGRVR